MTEHPRVAVIGAGPGGLATARWLKAYGFEPDLFEAHDDLGGQWSASNPRSGIWPQMVTNTFVEATRFSDLDYPEGTALFPHNSVVLSYLRRFAEIHGLTDRIQFNCRLVSLTPEPPGYRLVFDKDGESTAARYERVVVATGRFNKPMVPPILAASDFSGDCGIVHSFDYKDPDLYRGKAVLVAGGSISALEIASDLSMLGAKTVYLSQRRQRYVNPKMVGGLPLEYLMFTYRRGALALDDRPALAKDDRDLVLRYAGDPSRYGTPKPHPDFSKAGVTGSPYYLNLVAEGRVKPRPWLKAIHGRSITFEDGASVDVDGIIAGTGFALDLGFLSEATRALLKVTDSYVELDEFTFHPDLPGLAFVGLWAQAGSYPTPLEQQARYVAYSWSGVGAARSDTTMRAGLLTCRSEGHHGGTHRQNEMALRFARLCGTDPRGQVSPDMMEQVERSATTGLLFRLAGLDAFADGDKLLEHQLNRYLNGVAA